MEFEEEDLEQIVGSKSYRGAAIKESLTNGRAAYGPVDLNVSLQTSIMEVRGPFFDTVLDLSQLQQTEDGVSIKAVREKLDEIIRDQTEEHLVETYW